MLRMGCTPVIVLEGVVDSSKYKLMEKRYGKPYSQRNQRGNPHALLAKLIRALGLVCVQAPGEGEATCAALESLGLVDGCITKDADVLAFGGQTVYKSFSISTRGIKKNQLELCLLSNVREYFGITTGGMQSMQLVILLTGGDYKLGGTDRVGIVQAIKTVQNLLRNKNSDLDLIEDFWIHLLSEEDEAVNPPTKSCTGCRRCGCEGYGKGRRNSCHKKLGCIGCGTQPRELGGNGQGGCIPMTEGDFCKCVYCTWKRSDGPGIETMQKVLEKERRQSMQHNTLRQALKAYTRQREKALACAKNISSRNELGWQKRPDFDTLLEMFENQLSWDENILREKLIPLLLQWDLAHSNDVDIEFKVVKVWGMNSKGKRSGNQHSEVNVEFERIQGINEKFEEFDQTWLEEKTRNGKWSIRKTLVDEHCSELFQQFEEDKKHKKKKKKRSDGCLKITNFLESKPTESEISPAGDANTTQVKVSEFKTPSKVRKELPILEKKLSPESNGKQQAPQKDIRLYCSPESKKEDPHSGSESSFSKKFGSASRRLTFLSIYSDDEDEKIDQRPDTEQMELDTSLGHDVVDLLTPREVQRHSEGSIIDLLTPEHN
eukprot:g2996.t1